MKLGLLEVELFRIEAITGFIWERSFKMPEAPSIPALL